MADEEELKGERKTVPMDRLMLGASAEMDGLHEHAHGQAKTPRPKGRKTNKPVKVSRHHFHHTSEEGEMGIHHNSNRVKIEDQQHDETEAMGLGDDGVEEEAINSDAAIRRMKWDKRMRLTITKDFRKEKRQSLTGKVATGNSLPARRSFTCTVCQQAFLRASDCLEHMYTHTENMPSDQLVEALSNGHDDDQDKLEQADKLDDTMDTDSMIEEKVRGKTSDFGCPQCDLRFASVSLLEKHIQQSHPEERKYWECNSCNKTFLCSGSLNRHRRLEHKGEKSYKCPECSRLFFTANSLALHIRNHTGNRPFKCGVPGCDRNFTDASSANRHRRTHSEERPFVCGECGKAFKAQNHLREHTRLHTGEKPFVCEICGAGFAQSNGLKSHAKQHQVNRDNQCELCNKAFSHPTSLALHMKIHSGEKPYACELCDRTFRTACNLGAHKKLKHDVVAGKEDFICDVCGASFSHACHLGIHKKKKHSDLPVPVEKTFVCDICDMKFSAACNLGAHKKIKHADETEGGRSVFDCEICGAKFFRACNLSGHKRRKHGESSEIKESDKVFVCSLCKLRCSTLENLQEHQSKIHCSMPPFIGEMNVLQNEAGKEQPTAFPYDPHSLSDQQLALLSAESRNQSGVSLSSLTHENPITFTNSVAITQVGDKGKSPYLNGLYTGEPLGGTGSTMLQEQQNNKQVFSSPTLDGQAFFSSSGWF